MTTGSVEIGSLSSSAHYSRKTWSGADDALNHSRWNTYKMTSLRKDRTQTTVKRSDGSIASVSYYYDTSFWCPTASDFDGNEQITLLGKVAERARGHSFAAGIALAEMNQTLGLITGNAVKVLGFLEYARKGRYSKALESLGLTKVGPKKAGPRTAAVSDFVLEYQYGWKPLLQDIHEACKFLELKTSAPRKLQYEVSRTMRVKGNASPTPTYSILANGTFTRKYLVVQEEELSMARSLGLLNPAQVVWEKVPWSFVVDWFIPIGNYLDTLGVIPHLRATLYRTDFAKAWGHVTTFRKPSSGYYYEGGDVSYETVKMQRFAPVAASSVVVPMPSFKSLEKAFSLAHIRNAAALIWSSSDRVKVR